MYFLQKAFVALSKCNIYDNRACRRSRNRC